MDIRENRHNYGIDLLRIAAMGMIVAHHFALHSGISFDTGTGNDILMQIMALGGKTGVNIFVLITGFYSTGRIRREKILGLIGSTTFYSIVLTLLAVVLGSAALSKKLLMKAVLPWLLGGNYWFIITYLELYLLTPVLNKVAQALDTRSFEKYLGLFTLLLCIAPTVIGKFIEINDFGYNSLVWFVYLYFLGAYLSKQPRTGKTWQYLHAALGLIVAQIAACAAIQAGIAKGITELVLRCISDYSANAIFPLAIAVAMLLGFQRMDISLGQKTIQTIGSATLGIYLFHDNINFRSTLWHYVHQLVTGLGTIPFIIYAVISVCTVFVLGCMVELLRDTATMYIRKLLIAPQKKQPR